MCLLCLELSRMCLSCLEQSGICLLYLEQSGMFFSEWLHPNYLDYWPLESLPIKRSWGYQSKKKKKRRERESLFLVSGVVGCSGLRASEMASWFLQYSNTTNYSTGQKQGLSTRITVAQNVLHTGNRVVF